MGSELPASVAKVRDAKSGATVYIVGCVHGTRTSAGDVTSVVDAVRHDAVVLELCEARLKQLRERSVSTSLSHRVHTAEQYWGGPGPTALAVLLTLVYRLQRFLGGDPGAEFKAALVSSGRIICGDASASRTVRRLYRTFLRPGRSLKVFLPALRGLGERLLFPPADGVDMARVLMESRRAKELAKVFVPLLAGVFAISTVAGTGAAATLAVGFGGATPQVVDAFDTLRAIADPILTLYLLVTGLHFIKVLILDRDAVLSTSIRKAARRYKSSPDTVIVAVVGLMHVNGVVRYLQKD